MKHIKIGCLIFFVGYFIVTTGVQIMGATTSIECAILLAVLYLAAVVAGATSLIIEYLDQD